MANHKPCSDCIHRVFYGATIGHDNSWCRRNLVPKPNLVSGGYNAEGKELDCNKERTEAGDCGIVGKFFEPKNKASDKPYITIAVEPHGCKCNKEGGGIIQRCPFLVIGSVNYWSYSCRIFGPIFNSLASEIEDVNRHEGCLEAQTRFESDEKRRRS